MDYFKKIQSEAKKIGPGGWHFVCCGIQSTRHKIQRQNKAKMRRWARRMDKVKIKEGDKE